MYVKIETPAPSYVGHQELLSRDYRRHLEDILDEHDSGWSHEGHKSAVAARICHVPSPLVIVSLSQSSHFFRAHTRRYGKLLPSSRSICFLLLQFRWHLKEGGAINYFICLVLYPRWFVFITFGIRRGIPLKDGQLPWIDGVHELNVSWFIRKSFAAQYILACIIPGETKEMISYRITLILTIMEHSEEMNERKLSFKHDLIMFRILYQIFLKLYSQLLRIETRIFFIYRSKNI